MKGQSILEFIIAAIIFFAIIIYTLNYLYDTVWKFDEDHYSNFLESRSTQISEILVTSSGVWESESPLSVGLAENWPVLNSTKISWLNKSCSTDYRNLLRTLNIDPDLNSIDIDILEEGSPGLVCLADFNKDGVVNESDRDILDIQFGMTGPGLAADANNDDAVDNLDRVIWLGENGLDTCKLDSKSLVECHKTPPDVLEHATTRRVAISDSGKILRVDVVFW